MSVDKLQAHWALSSMPFGKALPVEALSRHRSFQEATARVAWAVAQRQVAVLTGEVGSGKTVAVRAALAGLEPARHLPVYVPDPTVTIRGVHTRITTALGGEPKYAGGDLAAQAAALLAGELDERGRLPVVVIDEAHLLSNRELESLRMLTNCDMDSASTFALVLVGQPTLRRRLRLAVLAALDQRVGVRYQMGPMCPEETAGYVRAHLARAGRDQPLFADDAIAEIHQASRGWPRAVNNLAVAAMVAAYAAGKAIVDKDSALAAAVENAE
ncbi:MAG: AAA family ATPase [Bifidobacteriaceae bacterium]|nr:AAA family ATPase [Bifidobacteriaceae bacterium]